MFNFTYFEFNNPEHIEYAENNQTVLYKDFEFVKFGKLMKDYNGYGEIVYRIVPISFRYYDDSEKLGVDAEKTLFVPIKIEDA